MTSHPHPPSHGHGGQPGALRVGGWLYDFMVRWFVMRGEEKSFRELTLKLAGLTSGETVLDIGCGTGTLALSAAERVGPNGHVLGIDPAPQLVSRARAKAARHDLPLEFRVGGIEALTLPDDSVDAVFSSFVMHHIPSDLLRPGFAEVARVLKHGGRFLIIDFNRTESAQGHPGIDTVGIQDIPAYMTEAGLAPTDARDLTATFRLRSLSRAHQHYGYALGTKSRPV